MSAKRTWCVGALAAAVLILAAIVAALAASRSKGEEGLREFAHVNRHAQPLAIVREKLEKGGEAGPTGPAAEDYGNRAYPGTAVSITQTQHAHLAFDQVATGPSGRLFDDDHVADELSKFPLDTNINYLAQLVSQRFGLPSFAPQKLANGHVYFLADTNGWGEIDMMGNLIQSHTSASLGLPVKTNALHPAQRVRSTSPRVAYSPRSSFSSPMRSP